MNDMRGVIVPKSDQINADDLLAGPITVTITDVAIKGGAEQPVAISFEGDNGKPYKPCKSMSRVLVSCWGPDASKYVGRSMTLYCDPKITWGGMAVGGIRISHLSHIDKTTTLALTETKGKKKPFTVQPLKTEPALDTLLADAREYASKGVASYQAFWKVLSKQQQAALLPHHEGLKAEATAAAASPATDDQERMET